MTKNHVTKRAIVREQSKGYVTTRNAVIGYNTIILKNAAFVRERDKKKAINYKIWKEFTTAINIISDNIFLRVNLEKKTFYARSFSENGSNVLANRKKT